MSAVCDGCGDLNRPGHRCGTSLGKEFWQLGMAVGPWAEHDCGTDAFNRAYFLALAGSAIEFHYEDEEGE